MLANFSSGIKFIEGGRDLLRNFSKWTACPTLLVIPAMCLLGIWASCLEAELTPPNAKDTYPQSDVEVYGFSGCFCMFVTSAYPRYCWGFSIWRRNKNWGCHLVTCSGIVPDFRKADLSQVSQATLQVEAQVWNRPPTMPWYCSSDNLVTDWRQPEILNKARYSLKKSYHSS